MHFKAHRDCLLVILFLMPYNGNANFYTKFSPDRFKNHLIFLNSIIFSLLTLPLHWKSMFKYVSHFFLTSLLPKDISTLYFTLSPLCIPAQILVSPLGIVGKNCTRFWRVSSSVICCKWALSVASESNVTIATQEPVSITWSRYVSAAVRRFSMRLCCMWKNPSLECSLFEKLWLWTKCRIYWCCQVVIKCN